MAITYTTEERIIRPGEFEETIEFTPGELGIIITVYRNNEFYCQKVLQAEEQVKRYLELLEKFD